LGVGSGVEVGGKRKGRGERGEYKEDLNTEMEL